ncbi:MAG: hypothetical protein M3198_14555 [Actinomycetota bacterium]|nr:hypothetical protein [Actinomycetota bacterium]
MTGSENPELNRRGAQAPEADRRRGASEGALTAEQLRTFLSRLHTPHRLDCPQIRGLLKAHRRLPQTLSPTAVGTAAAQLLTDKIAALEPPPGATAPARLPHRVLEACFVRGRKNHQAAAELGLSERQLTRERERAVRLLAAELSVPPASVLAPEPIPSIHGHIRRDELLRRVSEAAARRRLVGVTGEPGAGKTSVVAALAHALGPETVWWHRMRPGVDDSLEALLIELGHGFAREGSPELRDYLAGALPDPLLGVATRLALEGLFGRRRLLVLDDFRTGAPARALESFLEEAVARIPELSVVTTGAVTTGADIIEVSALTRPETAELLRRRGLAPPGYVLDALHQLSGGNVTMLAAVAVWWSGDGRGLRALERHLAARGGLGNLRALAAFSHDHAA